uniref:Nonstructural protein 7 n=1 Tax=Alphacoronavirus sp. TaxID=1906673 RepID=A0A8F0ZV39_9ALPC|nr:nonstructural protein 7 [Alphacoronavirus sp.]
MMYFVIVAFAFYIHVILLCLAPLIEYCFPYTDYCLHKASYSSLCYSFLGFSILIASLFTQVVFDFLELIGFYLYRAIAYTRWLV